MITVAIAEHYFLLKHIVILSIEWIEWPKLHRTIVSFWLCECEIENYYQLIGLQVMTTEIKNGIDWLQIVEIEKGIDEFKLWGVLREIISLWMKKDVNEKEE